MSDIHHYQKMLRENLGNAYILITKLFILVYKGLFAIIREAIKQEKCSFF